jgi:hypothetical protein
MTLEEMRELTEDDRKVVLRAALDKVAGTEEGKIVFALIFEHLGLFRKAETPEQVALANYAKFLLALFSEGSRLGVIEPLLRD